MALPLEPRVHETEQYVFDWKPKGGRGFSRALDHIMHDYFYALQCQRGGEEYWQQVRQDALSPEALPQPFEYIVLMSLKDTQTVVGFCLLRRGKVCTLVPHTPVRKTTTAAVQCHYPPRSWYVEFVCSAKGHGFGRALMEEIHSFAQTLGLDYITLSALPEVIMFYHDLGYRLTLNVDGHEAPAISAVAQRVRAELAQRKARARTHPEEPLRLPANVNEMLAEAPFNELLLESMRQHLSMTRLRGDDCKTNHDCLQDGVYMILSVPRQEMELVTLTASPPPGDTPTQALGAFFAQTLADLPLPKRRRHLEQNRGFMDQVNNSTSEERQTLLAPKKRR